MSMLGQALGNQRARKKNDFYPTIDRRAIAPLAAHLPAGTVYAEPMAGAGDLIQLLDEIGLVCDWACDIDPQRRHIARHDAMTLSAHDLGSATCFITNPAWTRDILHRLIAHLAPIAPTWFLFDASWSQTRQATMLGERYCTDIVSVGRLKWFPPPGRLLRLAGESEADYQARSKKNRSNDPPDDCSWYRFSADKSAPTVWHWPLSVQARAAVTSAQAAFDL